MAKAKVQPRLVDYSDSESSEDENPASSPPDQIGGAGQFSSADFFIISEASDVYIKKFRIQGKAYRIQLKNQDHIEDMESLLLEILRKVLNDANANPSDLIGVQFKHPQLGQGRRGYHSVPFMSRGELSAERLFRIMEKLLGYDGVELDEHFEIIITTIPQIRV